jgi:hypothetical protein
MKPVPDQTQIAPASTARQPESVVHNKWVNYGFEIPEKALSYPP